MNPDPLSLDRLNDIARSEPVSWWPLAAGWWVLIALAAVWLVTALVLWRARWKANAYRREGLRRLAHVDPNAFEPAAISALMKQVAIAAYSRENVAALSGADWLAFLNHTCPDAGFAAEPACQIVNASYEVAESVNSEARQTILNAARKWIADHDREAA